MHLYEETIRIPAAAGHRGMLAHVSAVVEAYMREKGAVPIRLVVTASDDLSYDCEVGAIGGDLPIGGECPASIFRFAPRRLASSDRFTVAHLVPTGIGAEVGGHAGDAAPTAKLLASVCDTLVTHPNVLNASDIIEIPDNALYVEGSVICQLLMGTVGLHPTRTNRLLVLMECAPGCSFQQCSGQLRERSTCGIRATGGGRDAGPADAHGVAGGCLRSCRR